MNAVSGADYVYVVRWHWYWLRHDVCVCGVSGVWMCIPDRNDLKLGTIVVIDTVSQPTDLRFKGQWSGLRLGSRRRFASPESVQSIPSS